MNLDRFCIGLVLLHLPLLWLPKMGLTGGIVVAVVMALCGILFRRFFILLLGVLLGVSYGNVSQTVRQAEITVTKQSVEFRVEKILKQTDYQAAIARLPNGEKVYLNWQTDRPLRLDHHYRADLTLRPISARLNIGNFDRQKWYFANHINRLATVKAAEWQSEGETSLRSRWLERFQAETEHFPSYGLLAALAFGERAWLKNEDWRLFQQTATAHLIAISGLHIALAAAFGFYFVKGLQWLCLVCPVRRLQAVGFCRFFASGAALAAAFAYSYLAGFAVPTLRALLAIVLVLLCRLCRRHYTAWQYWWRIVALLLIFDPLSLLSDSFWLSILAVASLIVWYRVFPLNRFHRPSICKKSAKYDRLFVSLLHLQIGIWLVFSPVQLAFFEGVSATALLANLLIVPLYSFLLVPLILFSLFTDNLFSTWQLADWLARFSLRLLEPLSGFWLPLNQSQQWLLLSVNLLILWLIYCKTNGLPYRRWLQAVAASVLFYGGFYLPKPFEQANTEWLNFDVGQGLAMALVYDGNRAVIYDTGAAWRAADGTHNSMAKNEILPYLQRHGIEVQAVFLSHDDNDHSGGVADLLAAYPAARLIGSGRIRYHQRDPEPCLKGRRWQFGDWRLTAVYPPQRVERAKNQDSCVIVAENGLQRILLTGDAGVEQERQFAREVGKIDFLQVGHHGSKTASSETLLAVTQPQLAVVSAGRWNPWNLPNRQVLARFENSNIKVRNTAEVGMVRLKFYRDKVTIEQARSPDSPWYRQFYRDGGTSLDAFGFFSINIASP